MQRRQIMIMRCLICVIRLTYVVIMRVEFIIFKVCLVVLNRMGTSSNIALEHDGSLEVSASCLSLDLGAPTLRSRWINLNIFRM